MMKSRKTWAAGVLLSVAAATMVVSLTNCTKQQEIVPVTQPLTSSMLTIKTTIAVTETNPVVTAFKTSPDFKAYKSSQFGTLDMSAIKLTSFTDRPEVVLTIPVLNTSRTSGITTETYLATFYRPDTNGYFSLVRTETGRRDSAELFTGEVKHFTTDGYLIGGLDVSKNVAVEEFSGNLPTTPWYEKYMNFNDCYQKKKAACENDWLCDIACSINPCFVAYVGACAVEMYW